MSPHLLDESTGLKKQDLSMLKEKGIQNAEDFLTKMAADPDLIDSLGLPDEFSNDKKRVLEAMAPFAGKVAGSVIDRPLVDHIPDMICTLALFFMIYFLFYGDRDPAPTPPPEKAKQVVVTADEGLAAFRIIRGSDVGIRETPWQESGITSVEAVVGRYLHESFQKEAVIDKTKLSSRPLLPSELDKLQIFEVQIKPSPILSGLEWPAKVGIVPLPRTNDFIRKPKIYKVYVLKTKDQSDGISAVVATTAAECEELASFLGRADLMAVGPVD